MQTMEKRFGNQPEHPVRRRFVALALFFDSQVAKLAARLRDFVKSKRLQLSSHLFWNSHRFFTELPSDIRQARLPCAD